MVELARETWCAIIVRRYFLINQTRDPTGGCPIRFRCMDDSFSVGCHHTLPSPRGLKPAGPSRVKLSGGDHVQQRNHFFEYLSGHQAS